MKQTIGRRILFFLAIMGPGIIAAVGGNDVGGIATYSQAGAQFGYAFLWILLLSTFVLGIVLEMAARMGVVTGKGLADLLREEFGLRVTFYAMIALLVANLSNTVAEFAGIAAGGEIFGIPRYILVPIAALVVWFVVIKGSYQNVEKVLLVISLVYIAYVLSGFFVKPDWSEIAQSTLIPSFEPSFPYFLMLVTVIGTTIAPWMLFYHQATVVEKKILIKDYAYEKAETYIGTFLTNFIAFFIIIATAATLFVRGITIESADQAAIALEPLAGRHAAGLFAIGLINAALFGAILLPLSTAFTVSEGFGWPAGIGRRLKEAPRFFGLYAFFIVFSALFVLIPKINLIKIMIFSQTINGMLLPIILILVLILANNPKVMGKYTNGPIRNLLAWGTVVALIVFSLIILASPLFR